MSKAAKTTMKMTYRFNTPGMGLPIIQRCLYNNDGKTCHAIATYKIWLIPYNQEAGDKTGEKIQYRCIQHAHKGDKAMKNIACTHNEQHEDTQSLYIQLLKLVGQQITVEGLKYNCKIIGVSTNLVFLCKCENEFINVRYENAILPKNSF